MSCDLAVRADEPGEIAVSGNGCDRGRVYAEDEYLAPKRVITTTIKIETAGIALLPVIGTAPVPKGVLGDCLKHLYGIKAAPPVKMGDVIVRDILGTGVDIIAARSV
jgi:CxxC motif-containing protein